MFLEMRFDLGTLDSGERSLPFGLLVCFIVWHFPKLRMEIVAYENGQLKITEIKTISFIL